MFRIRPILRSYPLKFSPQKTLQFTKFAHYHACLPIPLQSRFRWTYLWYTSMLALGVTLGLGARHFAGPLGLPTPGSREDELILNSLSRDIDQLDVVTSLRSQSYNLHTDTALASSPSPRSSSSSGGGGAGRKISAYKGWLELDFQLGKSENDKSGILGAMSGTRGLGVQRAFWNAETQEMVAVMWIGGGLSGWPGVVHGGAIATVFEEVMARMVRGPEGAIDLKHRPDTLSITYAKPTYALDFYILRASFSNPNLEQLEPPAETHSEPTKSWLSWLSPSKDLTKMAEKRRDLEIVGTLETAKGHLCVKAKGTFGAQ